MKIELEITGGFTGPAGKQVIRVALDQLPANDAAALRREVDAIPKTAWGGSFMAAHPQSWDFRHVLRVEQNGETKTVSFHKNQGPAELSQLADHLTALDSL